VHLGAHAPARSAHRGGEGDVLLGAARVIWVHGKAQQATRVVVHVGVDGAPGAAFAFAQQVDAAAVRVGGAEALAGGTQRLGDTPSRGMAPCTVNTFCPARGPKAIDAARHSGAVACPGAPPPAMW